MVKRADGDLWDYYEGHHRIVISTNIGWDDRGNNMGAGIALQAARRVRRDAGNIENPLEVWYGQQCERFRAHTPVMQHEQLRLIFFPVKPYRPEDAEQGWNQKACLRLIHRSAVQLRSFVGCDTVYPARPIAMSYVGAGNGALEDAEVERVLDDVLGDLDGITLVRYAPKHETAHARVPPC